MDFFTPKHLEFKISEAKKKAGVQCCAYGCKNKPCGKKKGMCHKHYNRYSRIKDPVYDRYKNFKHNALRRSKDFTVTLYQFWWFCVLENYIISEGRRGRKCTVDRIDNRFGYHIWNLQILTNHANVRKYHDHDKHFTELPEEDPDYLPF